MFVFDTKILDALPHRRDPRVTFIHRSLAELDASLASHGSRLVVLHGDPVTELTALVARLGADALFAAADYEPYARRRDAAVQVALADTAVRWVRDSVGLAPDEVLTAAGGPFQVFTPYRRAWLARFDPARDAARHVADVGRFIPCPAIEGQSAPWTLADIGFEEDEPWVPAGEAAAGARLKAFARDLGSYAARRNLPAVDGTSILSPHLRFGTVSTREALRLAWPAGDDGSEAWLSELIWRDFFQHVLFHFPEVVNVPFQHRFRRLVYPGLPAHFEAWCSGQTGYPIVDAAMRCLNETGWMHNRLRMIVASFLTKDLLIDYRRGEAYFAEKLLDFDLASNNGNWQWAASVGADAQPYFRVFNPVRQSEKFDPDGIFIRRFVPELRALNGPAIHFPSAASPPELEAAGIELDKDYPMPIVDHTVQRKLAIALLTAAT